MINPNIRIVTGSVPTFYGEVESSGSKELCNPILPTLTGSYGENLGGLNLVAGVELWKWDNMMQ